MVLPKHSRAKQTEKVEALGFGASTLGNLYEAMDDASAYQTVRAALDAGLRYFDTAPHYGHGLSERRLGAALGPLGASLTVSTKVGRRLRPIPAPPSGTMRHGFMDGDPFEPEFDYSYDGVMRAFEDSQRRLKDTRVSILLAHDIGKATHGPEHLRHFRNFLNGGLRAMCDLKADGVVDAIGLGVNEWEIGEDVLAHADLDVILLAGRYTLLEQSALESFLPLCLRRGVQVLAAGPFNSGILSGGTAYNYRPAPDPIQKRVAHLKAICDEYSVPVAAAALQFPLAHPAVTRVIAGMKNGDEVLTNTELMLSPIPSRMWHDLKSHGHLHMNAPTPDLAKYGEPVLPSRA